MNRGHVAGWIVAGCSVCWLLFFLSRGRPESLEEVGRKLCRAVEEGDAKTLAHYALPRERTEGGMNERKVQQYISVLELPGISQLESDDAITPVFFESAIDFTRTYRVPGQVRPITLSFIVHKAEPHPVASVTGPLFHLSTQHHVLQKYKDLPASQAHWSAAADRAERLGQQLNQIGVTGIIEDETRPIITWSMVEAFGRQVKTQKAPTPQAAQASGTP